MGAFFTNVQVHAGPARDLGPLIDALRSGASDAGMQEISDPSLADRTLCVLPVGAGGWVSVYDEATEAQDGETLRALASLASRALECAAFSVSVHDSDVLEIGLFERGEEIDRFNSAPEYFGTKLSKRDRERVAGHPERWRALLANGHTVADLKSVWHGEDLFAEQTLARTCELVGCDTRHACLGYRYASQGELPEGTLRLHFRSAARPAYEQTSIAPPAFRPYSPPSHAALQFAVGDALHVGVTMQSAGAEAKGLSIVLWGGAIERALIDVEKVQLVVGDARKERNFQNYAPRSTKDAHGRPILVVDLPEQAIPAGLPGMQPVWSPGVDMHKALEAMFATNVHINALGRVVKAGAGDLQVAFVPHENREKGPAAASFDLTIDPPLARPLRARADTEANVSSHMLRPLMGERYLVALVAIDIPRRDAAAYAREALEAALEIVGSAGTVQTSVFRGQAQKPKSAQGKVATALRGKRLEALVETMVDQQVVDLVVHDGPVFDPEKGPIQGTWGAAFGTDLLGDNEAERVPTLALWADTESLGIERSQRLEARWIDVVSRAMNAGGLQGVVLRGGWPATGPLDYTAYETACGTSGTLTTTRRWLTRWLRVPGNHRLWLGRALATHLTPDDRTALDAVADVEHQPKGLSITLRRRSDVAAFEQALASILPSQGDAAEAARAWYETRAHTSER